MSICEYNVQVFGAIGDGKADDTPSIQRAIDVAGAAGGGTVFFPPGHYRVRPPHPGAGDACLRVTCDNVVLEGCDRASVVTTRPLPPGALQPPSRPIENAYVPILFSTEPDTTVAEPRGILNGCAVRHLTVEGTGSAEYFPLSSGRGILARRVRDFEVASCTVLDLSMIGICVEGGEGYLSIHDNRVDNCFYCAINFNGRAYQSRILGNIVSRALFPGENVPKEFGVKEEYWLNSTLIQAGGPSIIEGNTVYDCGGAGILWGEADYHGVGVIANNLVKGCRSSGIKAAYHGPCTIQGNSVMCCIGGAGIWLQPGVLQKDWQVENGNNVVCGNLIVNCHSYGIACYTRSCVITGNQIYYITSPVQATSDQSQPDYFSPGPRTEVGIVLNRNCCATVVGNTIGAPAAAPDDPDASQYGIAIPFGDKSHVIHGNQVMTGLSSYIFTSPANQYGVLAMLDDYSCGGSRGRQEGAVTDLAVAPNAWRRGDLISTLIPSRGQPPAWSIGFDLDTVTTKEVTQGATKMCVARRDDVAVGDVVVAEMSTNTLFSSTVCSVGTDGDGPFVTLQDGATFAIREGAYVQFYRPLAHPCL